MTQKRKVSTRHLVAQKPKRQTNGFAAPHSSIESNHDPGCVQGYELVAAYHRQISALEMTVSVLRERLRPMAASNQQLAEARAHFFDLFQNAPAVYVVHDHVGRISELNKAALKLLGLQGQGAGLSLASFVESQELNAWIRHIQLCSRHLHGSTTLSLRVGKVSIPVQVDTAAIPTEARRPPWLYRTILTDIRRHSDAQVQLRQTQLEYRRLIDNIEGIVWEADPYTLDFTYVSGYAERLLGYPLEEWLRPGFWLSRLYVDDRERVANAITRAVAKSEELRIDYRIQTAERRLVWLHDNIALLEREEHVRLLGVAVDVTHRHEAEEQLRRTNETLEQRVLERTAVMRDTVRDLEAFSYSLSHDMRSPIRAMQGYAALLERMLGEKLPKEGKDYLRRIMQSAERLDLLVQDVLSYSRVARAPLSFRPIALDGLVDNIIHDYPALSPPKVRIQVQQPLLPVYGHEAFVAQALSNLLTNAVKFMPQGRKPRVRLWTEPTHRDDSNADWVRICVQDNGLGIAPADQQRIFRIFERIHPADKYEGTGIGLAIVQKAVERMGGRIGLQSEPGQGSKFWIELRQPQA